MFFNIDAKVTLFSELPNIRRNFLRFFDDFLGVARFVSRGFLARYTRAGLFSPEWVIPGAGRRRPPGAPVGCFAGVISALVGRRPRRAVVDSCRANSSFRVPLGPTGAFAGFASQNAARNPARHALKAIQLFRTWRNRMNRQGARLKECWGQIPPARDCWSRKSTKQPKVVRSISASARTEMVFLSRQANTACREAPPPRRTRWVFCRGYLSLSKPPPA